MSLKVLGKWKRWGASMSSRFNSIQTHLQSNTTHTFHEPSPTSPAAQRPGKSLDEVLAQREADSKRAEMHGTGTSTPKDHDDPDYDEDFDDGPLEHYAEPLHLDSRQTEIARRVMKKWRRVAGLKGAPTLCDELGVGEFQVNWTRAIAPRLEGRIREVGGGKRDIGE